MSEQEHIDQIKEVMKEYGDDLNLWLIDEIFEGLHREGMSIRVVCTHENKDIEATRDILIDLIDELTDNPGVFAETVTQLVHLHNITNGTMTER